MAAGPHSKREKYRNGTQPAGVRERSGSALRATNTQGSALPDNTSLPGQPSAPETTSPGITMAGGSTALLSQNAQTVVEVLSLVSSAAQQVPELDDGGVADALGDCFVSMANEFIQSDPSEYAVLMTDYLQDTFEETVNTDVSQRDRALELLWKAYRTLRRLRTEDMKVLAIQARAVDKMFGCIGQLHKASKPANAGKSMG